MNPPSFQSSAPKLILVLIFITAAALGVTLLASAPTPDAPAFISLLEFPSPLATPAPIALLGTFSYYRLWFSGERDESVREFIRQLGANVLSNRESGGSGAWLTWVGQDERLSAEFMSELQRWALDARPDIRRQTGALAWAFGAGAPTVQPGVWRLLSQMICREPDHQLKLTLLRYASNLSTPTSEQANSVIKCLAPDELANYEYATVVGQFQNLDTETGHAICQTIRSSTYPFPLLDKRLSDRCLTEELAVTSVLLLLNSNQTPPDYFDHVIKAIVADGRFVEAVTTAIVDRWPDESKWYAPNVIGDLKQLGVQASPLVIERLAQLLLSRAEDSGIDQQHLMFSTLTELPLAAATRAEVITRLKHRAEDPSLDIYQRSQAASWYGDLALKMDAATRQQAFDLSLSLWEHWEAVSSFSPSALTAVNRLAPVIGEEAVQRSISASLEVARNYNFYPGPRSAAIENLPNLLPYAAKTVTVQTADALVEMLQRGDDNSVRSSLATTLAKLGSSLDAERQTQIAQLIAAAFREGPVPNSTNSFNCTLRIGAEEGLRTMLNSASLAPQARRVVLEALLDALAEATPPENCLTNFIAARSFAEASRLLDSQSAQSITNRLLTVYATPHFDELSAAASAIARIAAVQVLSQTRASTELFSRFQNAGTSFEANSYGAALYLVAMCAPNLRPDIKGALTRLRDARGTQAENAGQVIVMIEALDRSPEVDWYPPEFDPIRPISEPFRVATEAMGGVGFLPDFCPHWIRKRSIGW